MEKYVIGWMPRYTLDVDESGSARTTSVRTRTIAGSGRLECFVAAAQLCGGVHLRDLSPVDQLEVRTRNTCYRITILGPEDSRVLVQGGAFFPIPAQAVLTGGTLGGSLIKLGWIGRGFCLEILHEGRRIVTTPVCQITRTSDVLQPTH